MGSAYPSGLYLESSAASSGASNAQFLPRTVLPAEYLQSTGNIDPLIAPTVALESPTDLAVRAVEQALERAGVKPEQLGLIIGDCLTPREKTPSEAQRVGKRFGLKIPAYDVTCGTTAFVQHLHTLSQWRAESVPEYVLLLSTNTPTENISVDQFRKLPIRFCDAAAAMVVSKQHQGRLSLVASAVFPDSRGRNYISIDTFGGLTLDATALDEHFAAYIDRSLAEVTGQGLVREGGYRFVCASASGRVLNSIANSFQINARERWFEQLTTQGDSLGSSVGRVLADRWEELIEPKQIVVAVCGSGISHGYAVLGGANHEGRR